jgi:hypothetical protein
MKIEILPAALTAAGLALAAGHTARAVEPNVPYSSGNLILGFQLSGDNDLEVNLGPYSSFTSATSPFNVSFGVIPADQTGAGTTVSSLAADLSATYGSGWASSSLLGWGVVGDTPNGAGYTTFLTIDSHNPTIPSRYSNSQSSEVDSSISSLGGGLGTSPSTVNSTEVASITVGSSNPNSWSEFTPGSNFTGSGLPVEQSFGADTATTSTLNLFENVPNGRNGGGGSATDVGAFTLNSSGDLTFTPASVPEPSTWFSMVLGALSLVFVRRRSGVRAS